MRNSFAVERVDLIIYRKKLAVLHICFKRNIVTVIYAFKAFGNIGYSVRNAFGKLLCKNPGNNRADDKGNTEKRDS